MIINLMRHKGLFIYGLCNTSNLSCRQMSTSFRQHLLASVKVVLDSRLGQEVGRGAPPLSFK